MIKITVLAFYLLREQEVLPMAKNKKTRKVTVKKKQAAKRNQGMHRVPRANRKYKDTVFRMLFSDKENLLSLYNAINRSVYENPEDLEIVTLENAIYIRCEMTPTSVGGEQQISISGGSQSPICYSLRQDCRDAQKKYVMHCMTRISQQECRGILERKTIRKECRRWDLNPHDLSTTGT